MAPFVPIITAALTAGAAGVGLITSKNASNKAEAAADKASAEQRDVAKVTQDRQLATLQGEEKRATTGRAPRGRRLLIDESTGEGGVRSNKLGSSG